MIIIQAGTMPQTPNGQATITVVSKDTMDDAGAPITYIATPNPEVTSMILSLPQGGKTDWMTHPVPGYLYILQGELTVEFEDGHHLVFKAGQAFMQARTKWHRGINTGSGEMRFLAVFFGSKGVPQVLNPPHKAEANKP